MNIPLLGLILTLTQLILLSRFSGEVIKNEQTQSQDNWLNKHPQFPFYILLLMNCTLLMTTFFGTIVSIPFTVFLFIYCLVKKRWLFALLQLFILPVHFLPFIYFFNEQYFYTASFQGVSLFYWMNRIWNFAFYSFILATLGMIAIDVLWQKNNRRLGIIDNRRRDFFE